MMSLYWLASWASRNARIAIEKASQKTRDQEGMQRSLQSPLDVQLMQACRKNGPVCLTGDWESLFLALPERVLASLSFFVRDVKSGKGRPDELAASIGQTLEGLRKGDGDVRFERVTAPSLSRFQRVLLCHGLSPVGDSILLLADLGRAHRAASAMGLSVEVMLAAVEWQKANRSVQQMTSLAADQAERGLIRCQTQRVNLYSRLGIACTPFAVEQSKLTEISTFYRTLAGELWQGVNLTGSISIDQQRLIKRPLGGGLEEKYREHLKVLRFFARQFNGLDEEYFWYFLNQFYAQLRFRGNSLKVAVESEMRFDQPFEELADALAVWDVPGVEPAADCDGLAVAYLPQYMLGGLRLLPYTPLSLDAMRRDGATIKEDHRLIQERMVSLDGDQSLAEIAGLVAATPLPERNRLAADLASFLLLTARKAGMNVLDEACAACDVTLASVFDAVKENGWRTFEAESRLLQAAEIRSSWRQALDEALTCRHPVSTPLHLVFALFEEPDWTAERTDAVADMARIARAVHRQLSK
ncbi:MAG: hypothetical protein K2Z81_28915 [Cyanobacteria bacterium]|nr:hypothetical protein [Cyanobacteriota bacterium]